MRSTRTKEETEKQVIELYRQALSEAKVAEKLGVPTTTVHYILVRHDEPRRRVGAPEKYPKTDFSGDHAEQARIVGFIEDCSAGLHHRQIEVQTGTTHPSQIALFSNIFGRYGHVGMTPGYNKQYSYYQWQLSADLNGSFSFLIEYKRNPLKFLRAQISGNSIFSYVGSLTDAEGYIDIELINGSTLASLHIANDNEELLEWTQIKIGGDVYTNNDGYQLVLRAEEAVRVLRKLPITHGEKARAKELILHHADRGNIGMNALRAYQRLRLRIVEEVRLCTLQARLEYISRHDKPHPYDPDQTIPII